METNTKDLIGVILDIIQVAIVVAGAFWAYFRFRKENPLYPRIEFDLDCTFFGPQHSLYLASFTITANNKGNVEHKFEEIRLRVLGIKTNEDFTVFEKYPPMANFPEEIMRKVNIVPPGEGYFFVRPGVNQTFNYCTQIPENIRFIIVRATFKYQASMEIHTAQKVFEVKE